MSTTKGVVCPGPPRNLQCHHTDNIKNYLLSTFPGEEPLKEQSARRQWRSIFDAAREFLLKLNKNMIGARFNSSNRYLMPNMKKRVRAASSLQEGESLWMVG